jgi:hypothetical protein
VISSQHCFPFSNMRFMRELGFHGRMRVTKCKLTARQGARGSARILASQGSRIPGTARFIKPTVCSSV